MKRTEALSVGQIIEMAIERTGNHDEYDRQQVCFLWPEIVGAAIARYTTRRWVDRDVMHVYIASASVKSDLSFRTPALVKALNDAVGREVIRTIIIH